MPHPRSRAVAGDVDVHPTAIVHPTARLAPGVVVGPYALIGPDVAIGPGSSIGPHAVVEAFVTLGRDNRVGPGTVLGGAPQHKQFGGERSYVRIGDRNVIREYVTVNRGYGAESATEIGDDNYLMSYVHVGHNCRVGSGVVLASGAELAGFVSVGDQANISGNGGVHQFVRVGRLSMVGGMSMVRQDVPPFVMVAGVPARAYGINMVGLRRAGVPAAQRAGLKRAFVLLYRSGLATAQAVRRLRDELGGDPQVGALIEFIAARSRGRGLVRGRVGAAEDDDEG